MNQDRPISYERLMKIACAMHTWIFCYTSDEYSVYDELGLTDEENMVLGSMGRVCIEAETEEKG